VSRSRESSFEDGSSVDAAAGDGASHGGNEIGVHALKLSVCPLPYLLIADSRLGISKKFPPSMGVRCAGH
jgi:hypothetical protein